MQSKESKIRALMHEDGIDGLLVFSPENFHYVTGYASHQHTVSRSPDYSAALLCKEDSFKTNVFVMDFEQPTFQAQTDLRVQQYDTWVGVRSIEQIEKNLLPEERILATIFDVMKKALGEAELLDKTIGVEMDFISLNFYGKLRGVCPKAKFVDVSPLFLKARSVKTEEEVGVFRELTRIQDTALDYARNFITVGASEREIANIYRQKVMESNYCVPSSWSMFASGENASRLGLPSGRRIRDGEIFKYDGGVNKEFDFYTTDFSRSYIVGTQDRMLQEIKKRLYEAQRQMIASIKPGLEFRELFNVGFSHVKAKYPCYERGHLGHSISMGPQTAEPPFINATNECRLEKNMVLCIEVPLYIEGLGGFNIEDMVLITENGAEILTPRTPHFLE